LPRNIGRTWSADEQGDLVDAFQNGESVADIAAKHGRTVRAIEARLEKLGLLSAAERTTADRFAQNATSDASSDEMSSE
jgi:transposase-like protein